MEKKGVGGGGRGRGGGTCRGWVSGSPEGGGRE